MKPKAEYRAVIQHGDGRQTVMGPTQTWESASHTVDKAVKHGEVNGERYHASPIVGGFVQKFCDREGWVLCNERPSA